jgi:hypothetical protein
MSPLQALAAMKTAEPYVSSPGMYKCVDVYYHGVWLLVTRQKHSVQATEIGIGTGAVPRPSIFKGESSL